MLFYIFLNVVLHVFILTNFFLPFYRRENRMIITFRNRHGFGPALKDHHRVACRYRVLILGLIGGDSVEIEPLEVPDPHDKVPLLLPSPTWSYRGRLWVCFGGGARPRFCFGFENLRFIPLRRFRVCLTHSVRETLENAPLDAFVAVDTAENQPFKVEVSKTHQNH